MARTWPRPRFATRNRPYIAIHQPPRNRPQPGCVAGQADAGPLVDGRCRFDGRPCEITRVRDWSNDGTGIDIPTPRPDGGRHKTARQQHRFHAGSLPSLDGGFLVFLPRPPDFGFFGLEVFSDQAEQEPAHNSRRRPRRRSTARKSVRARPNPSAPSGRAPRHEPGSRTGRARGFRAGRSTWRSASSGSLGPSFGVVASSSPPSRARAVLQPRDSAPQDGRTRSTKRPMRPECFLDLLVGRRADIRTWPSPEGPNAEPGTTATRSSISGPLGELLGVRPVDEILPKRRRLHAARSTSPSALSPSTMKRRRRSYSARIARPRAHPRADRHERRVLGGHVGRHDPVLVDLDDALEDARRLGHPAGAPAGHRIGLREAAHQDGPLAHPGSALDCAVAVRAVGKPVADLVRTPRRSWRTAIAGAAWTVFRQDAPVGLHG